MSILEEIQAAAVDGTSNLGTLLRKCKLLAAHLGSEPLENWLLWESNGYPDDVQVPDYRVFELRLKGHFSGVSGSAIRDAPIPMVCIPERVRKQYERYECRQSIAGIERVLKSGNDTFYINTGDLAVALGQDVYDHYNCISAWAESGSSDLVEVLNTVRNRILDFALALWKRSPRAGEGGTGSDETLSASQITQISNPTVFGGLANVIGAHNSPVAINVVANDFKSLADELQKHGLSQADLAELKEAVGSDAKPTAKDKLGPRVSFWIAKMVQKAADGSWQIGIAAAGELLYHAIASYYGFG
jgi:hypothetical protein